MKNPDPILIHSLFGIEGLNIYWYGIMIVAGIITAIIFAEHEKKRRGLPKDTVVDLSLICIPAGIVGARLFYVLFALDKIHSFTDVIRITNGGTALYGALAGGLIGILIYTKVKKISPAAVLDAVIPGAALAQSIGRWGDFFNQEAFGSLVTNPNHTWFPLAVKIDALNEIHYAAFFYESLWCLLIFIILWFVLRRRVKHSGDIALAYAVMYSFERMFVELLRADSLMLGNIRVSHLLSALLFIGCVTFIIVRYCRERKLNSRVLQEEPAPVNVGSSETEISEKSKIDTSVNEIKSAPEASGATKKSENPPNENTPNENLPNEKYAEENAGGGEAAENSDN